MIAAVVAMALAAGSAGAQVPGVGPAPIPGGQDGTHSTGAPPPSRLVLTSDELSVTPGTHVAVATGAVHARSSEMDVTCDRGRATYESNPSGATRQVDELDASGHVHLIRTLDGLVADAASATWWRATNEMVLEGDAVVHRGNDVLRGSRITVWLANDGYDADHPRVLLARSSEPARVSATRLAVRDGGRSARFTGAVHLSQGETRATSDRMDAAIDGSGLDQKALSRLVLLGHARIVKGAMIATARRATYDATNGDLVLTGAPRVDSKGDVIEGERITVNGRTGQARAERATAHVKADR